MNTRLLATKLHIPPFRPFEVTRPRLLEQMHTGLREGCKLTLLSAPAGYGKTTLAAGWVHSLAGSRQIGWLSLDPEDSDPGRFFAYFLGALQAAGVSGLDALLSLFDRPQIPPSQALLDELLNRLSAVESPLLLVLDDYQVITSPVVHDALAYILDHKPVTFHLMLLTRQDPPLHLARLRARRQITEIRAQVLRFTPEEACQYFTQVMQLDLTREAARALEERTEGWAVGLQLAGLALQNTADPERFIQSFRGSHRYVLDYLAEEVLARQSEQTRWFLARTSVLDRFNADLCGALTGQPDAQAVIDHLEKANLFIVPLDDERIWYRYHHLFRDYLTTLLDRKEQAELSKKASLWHEANGMLTGAVRYALASGDPDFSAGVIERAVDQNTTFSGGNVALLTSWLAALPAHTLQQRPRLNLNASRIFYLASQFDLAEKHLNQAEAAIKTSPPAPETELLLALAALYRGSLALVRGDIQQGIEQTVYAQARLPADHHLAHARACFNLGQAYEITDELDQAVENYLLSGDEALLAGVRFLAIQAYCSAAQVQVKLGDLTLAEHTCQAAVQMTGGERIPPLGLAYIVLGGIALERSDLAAAEALLQDGTALSRQGGLMDNAVLGMASLARLRICQGDAPGAHAVVQEARSIIQTFGVPLMASRAAAFLARLQLAAGKLQEAARWAAEYQAKRSGTDEYEELTLARVLLASGQSGLVPQILQPVLDQAGRAGRRSSQIEAMLLFSRYDHARKDLAAAEKWLVRAVALAAETGHVRIFLDEVGPLVDLLPRMRSAAPEFVDQIIKAVQRQPGAGISTGSSPDDPLIEPLTPQEQRVLELIVAGRSNQEIAAALVISLGTAKWHVHNILQKLGARDRPQAIARARELGY